MKERPILFSGEMVRGIQARRKTQTRRVVKPEHLKTSQSPLDVLHLLGPQLLAEAARYCPYGQPGDRLWVRETFYCDHGAYPDAAIEEMKPLLEYRADHDCSVWEAGCPCRDENGRSCWRPSIHMPRWASRITLEIVKVRVERLQEISQEDAIAEGIEGRFHPDDPLCWTWKDYERSKHFKKDIFHYGSAVTPQSTYRGLWESINGPGSWALNPWVWVVEFTVIEGGKV